MARLEEIPDSPRPSSQRKRGPSPILKYYLVAYNLVSALGWAYVLVGTLIHLFDLDKSRSSAFASVPFLGRAASLYHGWRTRHLEQHVPAALVPVLRRATTTFARVGWQTTWVQTLAIMEVAHSVLGWVRSPLVTVAMQVASRYYIVWFITALFPNTHTNPLYASMVLSWSTTEVIRYVFYAFTLLGSEPYPLLWLRYTTFWILYPTGASSEAFLILSSVPYSQPVSSWSLFDWSRIVMFCVWWPSLYVLYTHMIGQRRKVLGSPKGPGRTLGAKPKSL